MRAMLALALVVLSTVGATKSTARAGQQQCAWGAGEAVPQEGGAPGHNFTCTPPAIVGAGHTTLEVAESALGEDVYLDAQLFTYHPKPAPRGDGVVKVAVLSMGGADGKSNLSTSLRYVAKAGELRADLCVLPENFAQKHVGKVGDMNPPPQPVSGPIISAVSALARKYSMNIVAPIREQRGRLVLNTAVVIARNGSVVARYSKLFPVLGPPDYPSDTAGGGEEQVYPSEFGVVAVDLDFGRISLAICFDINFGEVFQQAANFGPDIMVWPSAMQTPDPFSYGYARLHQYHFVAVGHPGDVVDKDGTQHATSNVSGFPLMKMATLDIDRTFVHWDYNQKKVQQLLADHVGKVVLDLVGPPFYLLRSVDKPATSVRALIKEYGIETAREYALRSRQGLNLLRRLGAPVGGPPP